MEKIKSIIIILLLVFSVYAAYKLEYAKAGYLIGLACFNLLATINLRD
jgi:general stress protein CsbA